MSDRICGTCRHMTSQCYVVVFGTPPPGWACDAPDMEDDLLDVDPYDACHFDPPRWVNNLQASKPPMSTAASQRRPADMPHTLPTLAKHPDGHWIPNTPTAPNERWLRRPRKTPAEVVIDMLPESACYARSPNGGARCHFCFGDVRYHGIDNPIGCDHTATCVWNLAREGQDFDPQPFDAFEHHGGLMLHPSDDDRGSYDSVRIVPAARWDWAT